MNNTCSWVPKKHDVESLLRKRSPLTHVNVDLVHYLEHLLLDWFQANHLHDRVDVGIRSTIEILPTLPVGLSFGCPLLLSGVVLRRICA